MKIPSGEMIRDALPSGTIVTDTASTGSHYEIREVISSESDFSIVYRVFDEERGDDAVLKEFFPHADVRRLADGSTVQPRLPTQAPVIADALRQFRREGELLRRVRHENVIQARGGAFDANGTSYLAMDLVDGQTLQSFISRVWDPLRPIPLDAAWTQALLLSVLGALESLHILGIVHRDIKPANIMVPLEGLRGDPRRIKLIDFGSAAQLNYADVGPRDTIETSKSVLREHGGHTRLPFTPEYAPPEIALRHLVRPASDLYSVGATFFELLTGERPIGAIYRQQYVLSSTAPDPQTSLEARSELTSHYPVSWLVALDRTLALKISDRPSDIPKMRELMKYSTPAAPQPRMSFGRLLLRIMIGVVALAMLFYVVDYIVLMLSNA
jgi:serine/threonine protein kinase